MSIPDPERLARAIRAGADGISAVEAACDLLISTGWLHRDDFTSRFVTVHPGAGSTRQPVAVIDWPAAITALGSSLPCSGGERRILKITASLADGIPLDLQDAITGLDHRSLGLVLKAIAGTAGLPSPGRQPGGCAQGRKQCPSA
jgi:hypothetical protein